MLSFFERLDKFMKYKGLNDNKITIEAGISNGIIGKGRKRGSLSQENISKILLAYPELNANWLFTGNDAMLKSDNNILYSKNSSHSIVSELDNHYNEDIPERQMSVRRLKTDYFNVDKQVIPLFDVTATAGLIALFHESPNNIPLDYISVPNAPKCDGAIFVRGDSMYPLLKSGDIVCYKIIQNSNNIIFGEMYLLDIDNSDDQYLTVKYVQKSERDGFVKLVSENKYHTAKDEPISHIRALAIIKLTIRYNTIS